MKRTLRTALTAAALTALLLTTAPAQAQAAELLEPTGTSISLETPAPGHSVSWEMSARSIADAELQLTLQLATVTGSAAEGRHPLELELTDHSGALLASGTAQEVSTTALPLTPLAAGDTRIVHATASLPAEAGDEYRGTEARLEFAFFVQGVGSGTEPGSPGSPLAITGAAGAIAWVLVAALAIGFGTSALLRARRRRTEDAA